MIDSVLATMCFVLACRHLRVFFVEDFLNLARGRIPNKHRSIVTTGTRVGAVRREDSFDCI